MKKIITAINNPKLNEELKKENNFEIVCKDIQYKEAILEILEKNKNIDLIIISEQILGEINFEKLIEKIKLINDKIKIIFILEKENEELENILIKNNINEIYYNNEINLFELIKIINKKENNLEEEIIKLKKIINKFNNKEKKTKKERGENIFAKIEEKFKRILKKQKNVKKEKEKSKKEYKNKKITRFMSNKIITFSGNTKSGKTTLALIISQYLSNMNYKVLIVDADLQKQDLNTILSRDIKSKNNYKKKLKSKTMFVKIESQNSQKNFFDSNKKNEEIKIKNKIRKINLFISKNKINNSKIKLKNTKLNLLQKRLTKIFIY